MLVVLSKSGNNDSFVVEFENTGTTKETRGFQIKDGCVRDPYAPLMCGVACTGNISTKREFKPFYSIWHDMINRCYNENDKRHNAYTNVTVCDRWLVFENFYGDISKIDGYDYDKIINGELVLDKDIKQRNFKNKVYSVKTCTWVEKSINNEIQDGQQKPFIAISPTGEQFRDFNITRLSHEHNLNRRHVYGVLYGEAKTTRGWKFFYEEIV